jgi:hypothetical protein
MEGDETTVQDTSDSDVVTTETDETTDTIDEGMTLTLEQELVADLTDELSEGDELFNEKLMLSKIRNAIREVKRVRNYPSSYTDEMIDNDMYGFYSNIRNIALYDYNMIGVEGQSSGGENGTSRTYVDRDKLFNGVIPLSRF